MFLSFDAVAHALVVEGEVVALAAFGPFVQVGKREQTQTNQYKRILQVPYMTLS